MKSRCTYPLAFPLSEFEATSPNSRKTTWFRILAIAMMSLVTGAGAQTVEHHAYPALNQEIPDGTRSGLADTHNVTSAIKSLSSVRVHLNIAGRFNGDLYAYLRHVSAETTNFCVLLNRPGRSLTNAAGYSDAGMDIILEGTAANDIHLYGSYTNLPAGTPLAGSWQPDGRKVDPLSVVDTTPRTTSLQTFNGPGGSGEWTLFLADLDAGASNRLVSWELELAGAVAPPIVWSTPADIVYGTPLGAAQLNASVGGVAGSFAYSPPAGTILAARAGQILSVTFTPTDTANYVPVTANVSINVLKAPLTVTGANTNRLYGSANPVFTGTVTGVKNGETITATYACIANLSSPIGNYNIVPSATGSTLSNYVVTLVNGTLTVNPAALTVTAANTNRLYGSANPVFTGTIAGVKNGETITATYACSANLSSPIGNYNIVPSASGSTLSNYAVTLVNGTLTVNRAALTVTAANTNRLYGSANPVFTGTIAGVKNGETITATYACNANLSSPIGNYNIVPSASGSTLSNYAVTLVNGTLTVNRAALTVTAANTNRIYGCANPVFTGTITGIKNGETITATYTCSATLSSSPGAYDIVPVPSGATLANYSVTSVKGTLSIGSAGSVGIVNSSVNPQLPNQPVTFSFTLSPMAPSIGVPSGTVQFRVDGMAAGAPVALVAGVASYTTSILPVGTHPVVAEYGGDVNFRGTTNVLVPDQLINTPPIAGPDTIQRYPTAGVKVDLASLMSNDSDADGEPVYFKNVSQTSEKGGTVTCDGTWVYYTPAAGYTNVDHFTYTISDSRGTPVTGTVTVDLKPEDGAARNLSITDLGNSAYRLRFSGIPNRATIIQYTPVLEPPDWQTLTTGTSDDVGIFEYIDTPPGGAISRFYRALYP